MIMTDPRETYLAASVSTATPAQLLVMLCERLCLDLRRAEDALESGTPHRAHAPLLHAQDIVMELRVTLKVDEFEGGPGLAAIYDHLHGELIRANVAKDLAVLREAAELATQLRDTWREAALSLVSASA